MAKKKIIYRLFLFFLLISMLIGLLLLIFYYRNRTDPVALLNKGNNLIKKEKYNQAIIILKKTIKIKPNYKAAYNALGVAYSKAGLHKKSIQTYLKSAEFQPDSTDYINLGSGYFFIKQYDKCISSYEKAIELNPEDGYAYYSLGYVYKEIKERNKARHYLKIALKLFQQQNNNKEVSEVKKVLKDLQII